MLRGIPRRWRLVAEQTQSGSAIALGQLVELVEAGDFDAPSGQGLRMVHRIEGATAALEALGPWPSKAKRAEVANCRRGLLDAVDAGDLDASTPAGARLVRRLKGAAMAFDALNVP